jgi:hypothetical protein
MYREWFTRLVQVAAISFTIAAVCQEMKKPEEEREWHGKVASLVPYDFRLPNIRRIKESCWNPYNSQLFAPPVLGVGWSINLYALLERLSLIRQASVSEEDFLMPGKHMKELLAQHQEAA